jgi:sec-independent protein translocase protein TatA
MIFAKPWADALIVLLVVLLFFGPKRLPTLGRSLGEGMREFKDSITGHSSSGEEEADQPELSEAPGSQPAQAPAAPGEAVPVAPSQPAPPTDAERDSAPVASSEHRS